MAKACLLCSTHAAQPGRQPVPLALTRVFFGHTRQDMLPPVPYRVRLLQLKQILERTSRPCIVGHSGEWGECA